MDHVAIMRKTWGLVPKILTREKIIESRWYRNRSRPWGKIKTGDLVYFKNTGEGVTVRAKVEKVLGFENLTPDKVRKILNKYGAQDGIKATEVETYFQLFKNKKYCLLIYLKDPQKIAPFEINKEGFGAMAAWICVENIIQIQY